MQEGEEGQKGHAVGEYRDPNKMVGPPSSWGGTKPGRQGCGSASMEQGAWQGKGQSCQSHPLFQVPSLPIASGAQDRNGSGAFYALVKTLRAGPGA